MLCCVVLCCGMAWHGMARHGMTRHDTTLHAMIYMYMYVLRWFENIVAMCCEQTRSETYHIPHALARMNAAEYGCRYHGVLSLVFCIIEHQNNANFINLCFIPYPNYNQCISTDTVSSTLDIKLIYIYIWIARSISVINQGIVDSWHVRINSWHAKVISVTCKYRGLVDLRHSMVISITYQGTIALWHGKIISITCSYQSLLDSQRDMVISITHQGTIAPWHAWVIPVTYQSLVDSWHAQVISAACQGIIALWHVRHMPYYLIQQIPLHIPRCVCEHS